MFEIPEPRRISESKIVYLGAEIRHFAARIRHFTAEACSFTTSFHRVVPVGGDLTYDRDFYLQRSGSEVSRHASRDGEDGVVSVFGAISVTLALITRACYKLNWMVQYSSPRLDLSFAALSDATRRGIIDQLGRGDASITSLAEKFDMTLTGMKKHVQVLERAGLVVTRKVGRVRTCRLGKRGLKAEAAWIEARRTLFEARFEALDQIISEMKE